MADQEAKKKTKSGARYCLQRQTPSLIYLLQLGPTSQQSTPKVMKWGPRAKTWPPRNIITSWGPSIQSMSLWGTLDSNHNRSFFQDHLREWKTCTKRRQSWTKMFLTPTESWSGHSTNPTPAKWVKNCPPTAFLWLTGGKPVLWVMIIYPPCCVGAANLCNLTQDGIQWAVSGLNVPPAPPPKKELRENVHKAMSSAHTTEHKTTMKSDESGARKLKHEQSGGLKSLSPDPASTSNIS